MIFSHFQIRTLLTGSPTGKRSLSSDLNRTFIQVNRDDEGWRFPTGEILKDSHIKTIDQDENSCFILENGQLNKAALYSERTNRYYSLMSTTKAPTMLISGIPMHRIKDITPVEDTANKIRALGNPLGMILDTSTGLGYTAIHDARSDSMVITVEFDPIVLALCRMNPWSKELFTDPKIKQVIGDSWDIVNMFPSGSFDAILHDPPTFSLAGHLYSQAIYNNFFRILKSEGKLFHYIGNPNSRSGASVGRGVVKRLEKAGFWVKPKPHAFGVLAQK